MLDETLSATELDEAVTKLLGTSVVAAGLLVKAAIELLRSTAAGAGMLDEVVPATKLDEAATKLLGDAAAARDLLEDATTELLDTAAAFNAAKKLLDNVVERKLFEANAEERLMTEEDTVPVQLPKTD
jgi:redox-regulated HSP33 family molecular chaperone